MIVTERSMMYLTFLELLATTSSFHCLNTGKRICFLPFAVCTCTLFLEFFPELRMGRCNDTNLETKVERIKANRVSGKRKKVLVRQISGKVRERSKENVATSFFMSRETNQKS